jgi:hypothetical protein
MRLVTLTSEARVQSQASPCGIGSEQSGTAEGSFFPRGLLFSPAIIIPPVHGAKSLIDHRRCNMPSNWQRYLTR